MSRFAVYYRGKDYTDISQLSKASGIKELDLYRLVEKNNYELSIIQAEFDSIIKLRKNNNTELGQINSIMQMNFTTVHQYRQWFIKNYNFDIMSYCSLIGKVDVANLYKLAIYHGDNWLFSSSGKFEVEGETYYSRKSFFQSNDILMGSFLEAYLDTNGDMLGAVKLTKGSANYKWQARKDQMNARA